MLLLALLLAACGGASETAPAEESTEELTTETTNQPAELEGASMDSCVTAVRFPNAVTAEQDVEPGFSGDLNKFEGEGDNQVQLVHSFDNGKLTATRFLTPTGALVQEYFYRCQSFHGLMKFYHPNGNLGQAIPFRYGRRHGTGFMYDTLGTMVETALFRNDSLIGTPTPVK